MNCETLLDYLSDYIDRNLSETLSAEAEAHLLTCQNCAVVLNSTQRTILMYRQQEAQVIPTERRTALYDQIAAAFRKKSL